jgi:hypothetical protein
VKNPQCWQSATTAIVVCRQSWRKMFFDKETESQRQQKASAPGNVNDLRPLRGSLREFICGSRPSNFSCGVPLTNTPDMKFSRTETPH